VNRIGCRLYTHAVEFNNIRNLRHSCPCGGAVWDCGCCVPTKQWADTKSHVTDPVSQPLSLSVDCTILVHENLSHKSMLDGCSSKVGSFNEKWQRLAERTRFVWKCYHFVYKRDCTTGIDMIDIKEPTFMKLGMNSMPLETPAYRFSGRLPCL
jgi:hypothetical protein